MTDLTARQMLDLIVQTLDANKKRFARQRKMRGKKPRARGRTASSKKLSKKGRSVS
jgi:hypothetical protein